MSRVLAKMINSLLIVVMMSVYLGLIGSVVYGESEESEVAGEPGWLDSVSDVWDEGEYELEKVSVKYLPFMADYIADKWHASGDVERAYEIRFIAGKANAYYAFANFEALIRDKEFEAAEKYANQVLEHWLAQSSETIFNSVRQLLRLAIRSDNEYYYSKIREKASESIPEGYGFLDDVEFHYGPYLKAMPAHSKSTYVSLTDYLISRVSIDPEFLERYDTDFDTVRKVIEASLYSLIKSDDLIFSIMHAIALHAKEDPYFKLNLFSVHPLGYSSAGSYLTIIKRTSLIH